MSVSVTCSGSYSTCPSSVAKLIVASWIPSSCSIAFVMVYEQLEQLLPLISKFDFLIFTSNTHTVFTSIRFFLVYESIAAHNFRDEEYTPGAFW